MRGIFLATGTVGFWIVLQTIILNLSKTRQRFFLIFKLYLASFLLYCFLQIAIPAHFWPISKLDFFNGLLLHLLLFYAYMEFYYSVERPITFRILAELHNAPKKKMCFADIQSKYDLNDVLEKRLLSLVDNGYLYFHEGRFFPTAKGILLGKIFLWGSRLYKIRKSGFPE